MTGVSLDVATELLRDGEGNFLTELSRNWEIWGPNGGYLAALALRAAGYIAAIKRPASITCQFLRPPAFSTVELKAAVLHAGRRSEAIAVCLVQDRRLVAHATVRTAQEGPGYDLQHPRISTPPRPSELRPAPPGTAPVAPADNERYPFWENVERRPLNGLSNQPICREWVRFRPGATFGDPFTDAARALILLDTYGWPAAHAQVGDGTFIAPSLDITAWFHRPADHAPWLLIDETCIIGAQGLLGARGQVWDEDGVLLASGGAQLFCVPHP